MTVIQNQDLRFPHQGHGEGKNKKHPEMSKPKGFRSLRAFHSFGDPFKRSVVLVVLRRYRKVSPLIVSLQKR